MVVTFSVNIGSKDAAVMNLDVSDCVEGASADVSDDIAELLVSRGLATVPVQKTEKVKPVKGVPDGPSIAGETEDATATTKKK